MDKSCFALYRLPHERECFFISGGGETLDAIASLNGRSGFVIAPFHIDSQTPLVVISPERCLRFDNHEAITTDIADFINQNVYLPQSENTAVNNGARAAYAEDFSRFHARLASGEFSKIVLSRNAATTISKPAIQLFCEACSLYPRVFITLFSSPWSGTWLVASPEILLEEKDGLWHTIALAGTLPLNDGFDGSWSEKNIREQRIVATYIGDSVRPFAKKLTETGPETVRAGNLIHLRSDFSFTTQQGNIGKILDALHPTPAVCGLPKEATRAFIISNEHSPRRYYSGFCGPLQMQQATHLFVTLRCMEISSSTLYAGGGLLKESTEQAEWEETEAKMGTMRRIL